MAWGNSGWGQPNYWGKLGTNSTKFPKFQGGEGNSIIEEFLSFIGNKVSIKYPGISETFPIFSNQVQTNGAGSSSGPTLDNRIDGCKFLL